MKSSIVYEIIGISFVHECERNRRSGLFGVVNFDVSLITQWPSPPWFEIQSYK